MVCRLCYSTIDECIEIFSEDRISKYIKQFLELDITLEDPVSKLICKPCWEELKTFQIFYTRIKEAQRRLQLILKKEPTEKEYESIDNSTLEYDNTESKTDQENGSNESTEMTIQNEEQIIPAYDHQKTNEVPHPDFALKKVRHYRKITKTPRSFKSHEERKHFVDLMKNEEVIWNRTHTLHSSSRALTDAWKRIALAMSPTKTVHECKIMWKSLRDALRYERRKVASGYDQGNDLRTLLHFITSANNQNKQKKPKKAWSRTIETRQLEEGREYKIQNYHSFENTNPAWSERTNEGSQSDNISAYSESTAKRFSHNVSLDAVKTKPHGAVGLLSIDGSAGRANNMQNMNQPPPTVEYNSTATANIYHADVKKEFKDEVTDLVESISKALNRLVFIATNPVQIKSQTHEFKYDYIWKLIECLYAQMEETTINDINQKIINLVYEGCKVNVY